MPRFRRFELKGNQSKVLQECTPGGGLVADFADMVPNRTSSLSRAFLLSSLAVTHVPHVSSPHCWP